MRATLSPILALLALAGCATVTNTIPEQPGDACAIFRQNEGWWGAVKEAEQNWGAPPALQLAIIRQESAFRHDAVPRSSEPTFFFFEGRPLSSARGFAQAIDSTWDLYEEARGDEGLDREDFQDATDFVSWYTSVTLRELGLPFSNAQQQYLAYHEGWTGYRRESYRAKPWLMNVATRVQTYYDTYTQQIATCEGEFRRASLWWGS